MSKILPLAGFIPTLSPTFESPLHLGPMLDVFQRIARGESVRVVIDVPPRHGKSETLLHGKAWLLMQDPSLQIAYASYAGRVAEKKSRRTRELARRAGVPLAVDAKGRQDWRTGVEEGGMWATSVDGPITGEGFNVIVLDDLIRGRAAAESAAVRERTHSWIVADVLTRLEPGGSVICNGTRWHVDDPSGRLIASGWEHVSLPAINAAGEALWPERWPLSELEKIRESLGGEDGYEWRSLYLGQPRGRGSSVFNDATTYARLPEKLRVAIGCDFAFSKKSHADWSVAIVLGTDGVNFYLLDMVRLRAEPREFRGRIQLLAEQYKGASVSAYVGAAESGIIEFLREGKLRVDGKPATADKFSRALKTAAAWNGGKVLIPQNAPWLDTFLSEVFNFTGTGADRHDDIVDALVAAFDALQKGGTDWARVREANARLHGGLRASGSPLEPPLHRSDETGWRWSGMPGKGFG